MNISSRYFDSLNVIANGGRVVHTSASATIPDLLGIYSR